MDLEENSLKDELDISNNELGETPTSPYMTEESESPQEQEENNEIPDKFKKVMNDFFQDMDKSFPEYKVKKELTDENYLELFKYCKDVYPKHFLNILYKNEDIFKADNSENTKFLPDIEFKNIWSTNISDKTKEIIWKYLQIILFLTMNDVDSKNLFGDSADFFQAIDEDKFKEKLEKTILDMNNMFDGNDTSNNNNIPSAEDMHSHINELLDGKIGSLAKEIAEETANDLKSEVKNMENADDIFKNLLKNPQRLMKLVKSISTKLESKFKSGEIKESELLEEASELLKKMKTMPGMSGMDEMFKNMGMPGMPKGGKMDFSAMQNNLNSNLKNVKMRERLQKKLNERNEKKGVLVNNKFSTGETVEKSHVSDNVNTEDTESKKSKNKKNKRKNNKKKNKKKKGN